MVIEMSKIEIKQDKTGQTIRSNVHTKARVPTASIEKAELAKAETVRLVQ